MDRDDLSRDQPSVSRSTSGSKKRTSIMSTCSTKMSQRTFLNFWTIEQFSIQQELHSFGEYLMAPKFGDNEYEFALKLFPCGKDEETIGYLSLFLLINRCPNPRLRFRVSFTVETIDGPRSCALNKNLVTINRAGIVTASKFFSSDVLKSQPNRYLPKDALTIGVELTVFGEPHTIITQDTMFVGLPRAKLPRLSSCMREEITEIDTTGRGFLDLFETGELTDFTIVASCGRIFNVHMAILAARSEYFRALFRTEGSTEMEKKEVKFDDIPGEVLDVIIRHMYCPETTRPLSTNDRFAEEFIMAADRFMVNSLKSDCARGLATDINVNNVVNRMGYADLLQNDELFRRLLNFFMLNKQECLKTNDWRDLRKTNPSLATRILEDAIVQLDEPHSASAVLESVTNHSID